MRDRRKAKLPGPIKFFILLLALGCTSFALAWMWQSLQDKNLDTPRHPEPDDAVSLQGETTGSGIAPSAPPPQGEQDMEEDVPEEDTSRRPAPAPGAVPASAAVDNSYFDTAIFFGDSISTGIPLYKVAGNPDTVAYSGINPSTINTSQVIPGAEGDLTMLEAARQYGAKNRVYILLGANSLWMDDSTFVDGYQQFITNVKDQYPGAVIYLQSILPVTENAQPEQEHVNNENIRHFNELVQYLTRQNGVYYLDVAQAVMDNTGALPEEASLDGMHLTPEYYYKWFEYLKTHTAEGAAR